MQYLRIAAMTGRCCGAKDRGYYGERLLRQPFPVCVRRQNVLY